VAGRSRSDPLEGFAVVAFMAGRELAVIIVIALLVAGGSQLPKLVRSLGGGAPAPTRPETGPHDDVTERNHDPSEPDHPWSGD